MTPLESLAAACIVTWVLAITVACAWSYHRCQRGTGVDAEWLRLVEAIEQARRDIDAERAHLAAWETELADDRGRSL
jgi:hypothetical protein